MDDYTNAKMVDKLTNNQNLVIWKLINAFGDTVTTTANFVNSEAIDCRDVTTLIVEVRNTGGVNALKYNVDGSMDGNVWENLNSAVALAANTSSAQLITNSWGWLRVGVEDSVGGSHTTCTAFVAGKNAR